MFSFLAPPTKQASLPHKSPTKSSASTVSSTTASSSTLTPAERAARQERRRQRKTQRDADAAREAEETLRSGVPRVRFRLGKGKGKGKGKEVVRPRPERTRSAESVGSMSSAGSRKSARKPVVVNLDQKLVVTLLVNKKTWKVRWDARIE
ncbi:hypothetical protein EX30DRAFT_375399 [Ascodesmis nigricans]|uniref:Uncharacterized protein n=1 Tax=Ascodesmis nigricans TaxID=341454 RepID=A0A4S2MIC4_9PEZI|nr:hypothetical protein EX30DRAFT_375399 [Ascodesmis nigricans]